MVQNKVARFFYESWCSINIKTDILCLLHKVTETCL